MKLMLEGKTKDNNNEKITVNKPKDEHNKMEYQAVKKSITKRKRKTIPANRIRQAII